MAEDDFSRAVEDGLRLSKRIYFGKDRAVAPPKPVLGMDKNPVAPSYLPGGLMVYAVIGDPAIVDNPDIPSYQPHVHGRCDPPALIPLQMNGVAMELDCYLDTAFVTVSGSWRVHCVMGSRKCDCRIAIPMGEQGSILGVEVEVPRKLYSTRLITTDDKCDAEKAEKFENAGFLKSNIFTLTIPQVDGGTNISIKVRWSQKLLYHDGQFTLNVPFSFPEYVTPAGKKISKKEKIKLNINSGPGSEVLCNTSSHPLKELRRQAGKLDFLYESEVLTWSSSDLIFTYTVASGHTYGGVVLQSPSPLDIDKRDMFCCYLFPANQQNSKVFRKEVVFVVDISGSMRGRPLEQTKSALFAALSKLDTSDMFGVVAFNSETYLFSSSLEPATAEAIENVTQWINMNFVAGGGTDILLPLNQAIKMLSNTGNSMPVIFLITDGAVENERHICDVMKSHLSNQRTITPRIFTFGIGSFCNHHFLRMLATIGRGCHDAAYDLDSIEVRMGGLYDRASSVILSNIAFESLDDLDDLEVYPSGIPDLSSESTLIVSGRYHGQFPETLRATGILADMSNFSLELKVQEAKDMPLDRVLAKQHIELLTAQAWFSEKKEIEEKVASLSVNNSIISEYTQMILVEAEKGKQAAESTKSKQVSSKVDSQKTEDKSQRIIMVQSFGVGFGNLAATAENIPPGSSETKPPEAAEIFVRAASSCCGKLCNHCCCMCCIQTCSRINDQCAIALTQLCGALSCLGCFACCNMCCGGQD